MNPEEYSLDGTTLLAEVALALSMAFFCLLVLALISMAPQLSDPQLEPPVAVKASDLERGVIVDPGGLAFLFNGAFYDSTGQRLGQIDGPGRTMENIRVLAVSPELTSAEMLAVRDRLAVADLTVTVMPPVWLAYFKRKEMK